MRVTPGPRAGEDQGHIRPRAGVPSPRRHRPFTYVRTYLLTYLLTYLVTYLLAYLLTYLPVGPPPTTTSVSIRRRSSSVRSGALARSSAVDTARRRACVRVGVWGEGWGVGVGEGERVGVRVRVEGTD